jgi:hypothetical protein
VVGRSGVLNCASHERRRTCRTGHRGSPPRTRAVRALPDPEQAGRGRHGRRLPGRARGHREEDRAQGLVPRSHPSRRSGAAVHAGSQERVPHRARERHRHHRLRPVARRLRLHRDGVSVRSGPGAVAEGHRTHAVVARPAAGPADGQGAAGRARTRDHPPRHEAREHLRASARRSWAWTRRPRA